MTERESLSRADITVEYITAGLSGILGGILGIVGAAAEGRVLAETNPDLHDVIFTGGVALVGVSLMINGGVRAYTTMRRSKEQSQRE